MRWIRLLLFILVLSGLLIPISVQAAPLVVLTVRASNGIADFTIIYVNDNRMDLSWTLVGSAAAIMIRARYGSYPDDIPNTNTAPSDGYLVYSGNGTAISDVSMDFETNTATLYYAAWAQKADGTWFTGASKDWKESVKLTLIAILGFVVAMTYFAFTKRVMGLSFVGAFAWLLLLVYTRVNPINNLPSGSYGDTLILFACILMFAILLFTGWKKYSDDKTASKGKKVIHYNEAGDYVGRHEVPDTPSSHRETPQEYRQGLHERIMNGRQNRRRYGR